MISTDNLVILIDRREQRPLVFDGVETRPATLKTADYSCIADGVDLQDVVAIERKSVSDLLGCVGQGRDRFERELERLEKIRFRALVVEGTLGAVIRATGETRLTVNAVVGSTLSWIFKYHVPVIFADDRALAARAVVTLLRHAARYELAARVGCGIAGQSESEVTTEEGNGI